MRRTYDHAPLALAARARFDVPFGVTLSLRAMAEAARRDMILHVQHGR